MELNSITFPGLPQPYKVAPASHLDDKNNPHVVTPQQIGALSSLATYYSESSAADIDTVTDGLMLVSGSLTKNCPVPGFVYILQMFYGAIAADRNRMQIAFPYKAEYYGASFAFRSLYNGVWSAWRTITPKEIGARPDTWLPTAVEIGAHPDTWMPTAEQVGARPNTWTPTAEDVGAAPAGFGLGRAQSASDKNIDDVTAPGWYHMTKTQTIGGVTVEYCYLHVTAWADGAIHCTQVAYLPGSGRQFTRRKQNGTWSDWVDCSPSAFAPAGYGLGSLLATLKSNANSAVASGWYYLEPGATNSPNSTYYVVIRSDSLDGNSIVQTAFVLDGYFSKLVRRRTFGTWGAWEWENPPMALGVEYRTTERWDGQTVFCKLVQCGKMPNATTKSIDIGAGTTCKIIRCKGRMVGGTNYLTLPFKVDSTHEASCHGQNQNIVLYANYDLSNSYNAYIAAWYTKD